MKKLLIILTIFLASCANNKIFTTKEGITFTAEPYGWANENTKKDSRVEYEINGGNVIFDIFFIEIALVPIYLTGWQLYEPIKLK